MIWNFDTLKSVSKLKEIVKEENICFLSLANAYRTCGAYQKGFGSQEENVMSSTDGIVTLENVSQIKSEGEFGRIEYKDFFKIPPGGNYFLKLNILDSNIKCSCISTAFADFRTDCNESELNDFKDDESKYIERIELDIVGTLMTAIDKREKNLILGASGCGAFNHDPLLEAKAWLNCLSKDEFKNKFDYVLFSIKDKEENDNLKQFRKVFNCKDNNSVSEI